MDLRHDEYGIIAEIVRLETRWLRHYIGQVINDEDELNRGRVQVSIPMLGLTEQNNAPWCNPRYISGSQVTPRADDWVEVWFIDGDPNKPVYLGIAAEMKDMILANYTDKKAQVIHEDIESGMGIVYDKREGVYKIGEASEAYVKGDTFKTEFQKIIDMLQQLQLDFAAWVPVPNDGGAALKAVISAGFAVKPNASASSILSELIKGE